MQIGKAIGERAKQYQANTIISISMEERQEEMNLQIP